MVTRAVQWAKDALRLHSVTHSLRSPHWRAVEKNFLELNGVCAACGGTEQLQVHHKKPFHLFPELELEPKNLITLCEVKERGNHHLNFGHHGRWANYNPTVLEDVAAFVRSTKTNPFL